MANQQAYPYIDMIKDQPTKDALRVIFEQTAHAQTMMRGPVVGTLDPDTKPRGLGMKNVGLRFLATDYNRIYVWNGSGWEDDPASQPARGAIHWFAETASPGNGWVRAQGGTAAASTPDGKVEFIDVVNVNDIVGLKAWVRV